MADIDYEWYIHVKDGTNTHVYGKSHIYSGKKVKEYAKEYAKEVNKQVDVYRMEYLISFKPNGK